MSDVVVRKVKVTNPSTPGFVEADIGGDASNISYNNNGNQLITTASNVQDAIDQLIENMPEEVRVTPESFQDPVLIATITIGNNDTVLNMPRPLNIEANPSISATGNLNKITIGATTYNIAGSGGGDTVIVTPTLLSGTEVGVISVNGSNSYLYAPTPIDVEANPAGTSGSNLTRIKIDGTDYNIQGGGSTVLWNQIQATGTKIAEVTIDGNSTDVYAPNGGGSASSLDDLTDVSITSATSGQILKYNGTSWVNANESSGGYVDVIGTLTAGQTSITLSDASITTDSTFDFYTDTYGINPTTVSVSTGSITLTFESQSTNVGVKVRVSVNSIPSGGSGSVDYYVSGTTTVTDVTE